MSPTKQQPFGATASTQVRMYQILSLRENFWL